VTAVRYSFALRTQSPRISFTISATSVLLAVELRTTLKDVLNLVIIFAFTLKASTSVSLYRFLGHTERSFVKF
jgi:hypothetical protein